VIIPGRVTCCGFATLSSNLGCLFAIPGLPLPKHRDGPILLKRLDIADELRLLADLVDLVGDGRGVNVSF
jgi:hypothetical protein